MTITSVSTLQLVRERIQDIIGNDWRFHRLYIQQSLNDDKVQIRLLGYLNNLPTTLYLRECSNGFCLEDDGTTRDLIFKHNPHPPTTLAYEQMIQSSDEYNLSSSGKIKICIEADDQNLTENVIRAFDLLYTTFYTIG